MFLCVHECNAVYTFNIVCYEENCRSIMFFRVSVLAVRVQCVLCFLLFLPFSSVGLEDNFYQLGGSGSPACTYTAGSNLHLITVGYLRLS